MLPTKLITLAEDYSDFDISNGWLNHIPVRRLWSLYIALLAIPKCSLIVNSQDRPVDHLLSFQELRKTSAL